MTDIEKKALALVTQLQEEDGGKKYSYTYHFEALCRAIERHEAFRQEVSDALLVYQKADGVEERSHIWDALTRFIIPKPDPLVEALHHSGFSQLDIGRVEAALAARGLEIREKQP